ncbi:hypothetical protein V2W30_00205 [Streptomyces sp. Q6]|uniref:Uncharacterized protein n=1 Tax=Streptomyces citrinus TaxID=3118173 RepID=A0ACD5A480_9ACTN
MVEFEVFTGLRDQPLVPREFGGDPAPHHPWSLTGQTHPVD